MDFVYYNSCDPLFKSKYGAIIKNEEIKLRLRLKKGTKAQDVCFIYHIDGGAETKLPMNFDFSDDTGDYYTCSEKFSENIYWYHFAFKRDNTVTQIFKDSCGNEWQLTVYKETKLKKDLIGGVIYQIFPDRFYKSEKAKINLACGRHIVDEWDSQPAWKQNVEGATLGNDFYCGNLKGIEEKLDYLKDLGVTIIYLNPIFLASSNHRYNTADYDRIDTLLGDEKDFSSLCKKAHKKGIKIILDGVFSHTGDDSRYFDRYGDASSDIPGACQSENSPYRSWYKFVNWPNKYHSWWGVETLPEINEDDEGFLEYICSRDGVLRRWLRLGADGWRLDVADELPDVFLDKLHTAILEENPNAYILGEVWEDASNKISYGERRRYLLGDQLDSVMNYPFATAIVDFVKGGDGDKILEVVETLRENYPKPALDLLMNHIGTHDTARILTILGFEGQAGDREWQSKQKLTPEQIKKAKMRLKIASAIQFTLPGIPSVYYGDEVGLEGWADPFCRGTYPWGKEDKELLEHYKALGKMRKRYSQFANGEFKNHLSRLGIFSFIRENDEGEILVTVNRWGEPDEIEIPERFNSARVLFGNKPTQAKLSLDSVSFSVLYLKK